MHTLIVTPTLAPFYPHCELGAYAGQLAEALSDLDIRVTVVTNYSPEISPQQFQLAKRLSTLSVTVGEETLALQLFEGTLADRKSRVYFVAQPHPVLDERPQALHDVRPYVVLPRAAFALAEGFDVPLDILHCFAWPTGLLPWLLKTDEPEVLHRLGVIFTCHDVRHAPAVPRSVIDDLGLGNLGLDESVIPEEIDLHETTSLAELGARHAHRLTLLSPSAARDAIALTAHQGDRHAPISGILGGVDASYDPATDARLAAPFSDANIEDRQDNTDFLRKTWGLPTEPYRLLIAMVGPFDEHSGIDQLLATAAAWAPLPVQFLLAGPAQPPRAEALTALADAHPAQVVWRSALDDTILRHLLAGAEVLARPGAEEPSALVVLKALRYGAIPLVSPVGANRDTVIDFDPHSATGTGVVMADSTPTAWLDGLARLLHHREHPARWRALQRNALRQSFSWRRTALAYRDLYRDVIASRVDAR